MADRGNNSQSMNQVRHVIDWEAVGGLVFEWIVAIGQCVIAILVLGLLGGYAGTFVDTALSFVNEDWMGRGREWGWILGAGAAAIGLPLGWTRVEGQTFSVPSPRKLRKKVLANRQSRHAKKSDPSHEFRSVSDVFKGGGVLGLIGVVVGFALGGILLLAWFSLSMSPFSPAAWFNSIEIKEERIPAAERATSYRDDRRRTAFTTSDANAAYLFLGPILILGVGGAVVGTAYGTVQYGRYLLSVPAAQRERQQLARRKPVVDHQQARAAAEEQKLPTLAAPPRQVSWRLRWQLLQGKVRNGVVFGGIFTLLGIAVSIAVVFGWLSNPTNMPLIAVVIPLLFVVFGSMIGSVSVRLWNQAANVLRYGYLARCQTTTCRHPQTNMWKPYNSLLEELRTVWDTPLSEVSPEVKSEYNFSISGVSWNKTTTDSDVEGFERFSKIITWFARLIFGLMFLGGAVVTGIVFYVAIAQQELVAWFVLIFAALWWTILILFYRLFTRKLRLLTSLREQSLKTLGIKPIVDCKAAFTLPNGQSVEFKTEIDLSRKLDAGDFNPEEIVVYDPVEPSHALLLSRFRPVLGVSRAGQWDLQD